MNLYSVFQQHPVVCTDSRNCPEGSVFFALRGDNFDANLFAAKALQSGCAFAVVDNPEVVTNERYILVENVLEALQQLAREHRQALGTKIVGITGTNGKTTTKELIASVLKQKYNVHFTQGNFNNHIGVPLTLLQLTAAHEMAVIEMGANHPGEIKILSEIACPDFGIITNVGKAHLEGFGSFEGVKKTKGELYDYARTHGAGLFINSGNHFLMEMVQKAGFEADDKHLIKYNLNGSAANVNGKVTASAPFVSLNCVTNQGEFNADTRLIGDYNAENILAAATIGNYFGLSNDEIKCGLETYEPKNNRSQLMVTDKNKLIVDAYNANPTSMKAAIGNFATMQVSPKAAILGDMLELGEYSADEHQAIVSELEKAGFEQVVLVGPEFVACKSGFHTFEKVEEARVFLENNPIEAYYVLIKGSRGIKLEKVIELL
ncbi:MAG: UDP-N-acetylmuramoyl-tripeptide--D-alanyl-D-alanine ligase [Paludibacter sp.]|nr:UDP-N-acetylmuramoyl-tripeptide--D-alanyl-D-alanine ligase [Paludibacter sp.]